MISIGCQVCIEACPFGTMQFNDNQEIAVKCNLCAERLADSKRPVCVSVCPWSHPRTLPHRLITELVVRNRIARRVFSPMDDLFYGKKSKPASPPKWATHS